ncbi:MAG: OmpA family protein [Bacteroidetes bacterium]|nr:OmpA family protein [Bacteroidota bacterium]MCA6443047.1 OmpA family protein [Bacteroidota bacterium]
MNRYIAISFLLLITIAKQVHAQTDPKLAGADKLYIKMLYKNAAIEYEEYLKKNPKDFYASKQAALCYSKLNDHNKAIDYWPAVIDNALATEQDKLAYGKCLLSNYRIDDAKKVFNLLKNSTNKEITSWSKVYETNIFYEDSVLAKATEVRNINTLKSESNPALYAGKLVYIAEEKNNPLKTVIKICDKSDSVTFSKNTPFNSHIQSKKINGAFCFSKDDSSFYFTRLASKSDLKKIKNTSTRFQIFTTRMNKFGDAHPEFISFQYNSLDYDCMHPAINKEGNKLYFVSNMPGGLGGYDIWVCEKQGDNWVQPVNMGSSINTSGNELFPFVDLNGSLFYSSDMKPGLGGLDIFYADYNSLKKEFAEPENLGFPINSNFDDFGIYLRKGNRTGYMSSNRKNGQLDNDIYFINNNKPKYYNTKLQFIDSVSGNVVSVNYTLTQGAVNTTGKTETTEAEKIRIKTQKTFTIALSDNNFKPLSLNKQVTSEDTLITVYCQPKTQKSIQGRIIDKESGQPLSGVKVAIYDETGTNYLSKITDESGRYQVSNLPVDKALFIGSEKKPDYFSNTEKFFIRKDSDLVKDIYTQKIVVGKAIKIDNIYFDAAKWAIRADAALELDKLVQLMKDNPDIVIELSSHTDCNGNAKSNLILSDKRAKSSTDYILSKGISKIRIKGKGYGESKLLNNCACEGTKTSDCKEEEHAQNRRTEFKVTGFIKR